MNYERFKKIIVSLSLMCVFMFSTIAATVVPANAQGYYYPYQVGQPHYRVYWGYRSVYGDPWVGYRYRSVYPYRHVYNYPYGYYPYRHHYRHHWYHHKPFRSIGDFFDWLF